MQIAYYRHTKLFFLNVSVLNIKMAKAFFFLKEKVLVILEIPLTRAVCRGNS